MYPFRTRATDAKLLGRCGSQSCPVWATFERITLGHTLEPELVAEPLWHLSAYKVLPRSRWEAIRRAVIAESGSKCSACGMPIERAATCHKVWEYDESPGTALLTDLKIICRPCNGVHHFGQATNDGWGEAVLTQVEAVNSIDRADARAILDEARREWDRRSRRSWSVAVDPALLVRFPELTILDGRQGNPGDGRERRLAG